MEKTREEKAKEQYERMMFTPIPQLIVSLSIPTIISMMVTNLYNLVDTAFVGTINTSASGAVGVVFGFMAILQAIGFTFGQGSGSMISRMLGAKELDKASKVASTALLCSFLVGVVACIICGLRLDALVTILGSTKTIAPYAKTYISFILVVGPLCCLSFTLNNILRYEGRAFFGMIGLGVGAVLNIGGDALFLYVMKMGIAGAGLSTALSQVVSCFILLVPFFRGQTQCRLSLKNVSLDFSMIGNIILTGLPSLLRQGLNSVTTIFLNNMAGVYGDAAVAGMSIVNRLFFFLFSVSIGVGQGFQPVSGFSYGAKKFDRLRQAYKFTFILSECLMIVLGALLYIFAPQAVWWMRKDPEVVEVAVRALRLQCLAVLALPICMVTEMTMQSIGKKWKASFLSCMRNGCLFIPLLFILSYARGLSGIQEAQPLAYLINVPFALVVAVGFFKNLPKEYKFWGWQQANALAITDEYKGIKNPLDLYDALSQIWCADTCAPRMRDQWTKENKTLGQCSITAFLVQDIFGGKVYGILRDGGNYHCYNVIGKCRFDLTSEQFLGEVLNYEDNPEQFREDHFAKEEKKQRYEYLKAELKKYCQKNK